MDTAVVSDRLKELLAGKDVRAAVFTTFGFEPEFFELEVIPLLLPDDLPFSTDSRVKLFQVREALRESAVTLDVFYDLNLYRREGQSSPTMEYGCHGVYRQSNAFHGKLVLILAYDKEEEVDCLLVGAGSNNLTRAGWWDNIECQHWETLYSGETSALFLKQLREDVDYLRTAGSVVEETGALGQIGAFLADCRYMQNAPFIPYYNLNHINSRGDFAKFLTDAMRALWSYSNWTLEIISPYFAEQTDNREHEFFFDLGVQAIHLLLPFNQNNEADVDPDYLRHIEEQEGIEWAGWSQETARALGIEGQNYRRLHAKVYHFYNKMQAWAFVGSVNFSRQAMTRNVEAGFLVKLPGPAPLLRPLQDTSTVTCSAPEELPPGVSEENELDLPPVHLRYDWMEDALSGAVDSDDGLQIDIVNAERQPVIEPWTLDSSLAEYHGSTEALQALLKNGSLVKVRDIDTGKENQVLLQQTGWSHKPLSLPDLTPEQILAIYADLSPERRQVLLMNAKVRQLVLAGEAGEMTLDDDTDGETHFFSEYAEIFHAFKQLKRRLLDALADENFAQVDYYLTGKGVDSLPTLIGYTEEANEDTEAGFSAVTAYLVLLSVREIYQMKAFKRRPLVNDYLEQVEKRLHELKSGNRITLADNSPVTRERFFNWYEKQFSKDYKKRVAR